jgi:hypothetical protein
MFTRRLELAKICILGTVGYECIHKFSLVTPRSADQLPSWGVRMALFWILGEAAELTPEAGTARRHVGSSLPETPCISLIGSGEAKMHERKRVALHGWCDWNR